MIISIKEYIANGEAAIHDMPEWPIFIRAKYVKK
jgi:hypothetical protein